MTIFSLQSKQAATITIINPANTKNNFSNHADASLQMKHSATLNVKWFIISGTDAAGFCELAATAVLMLALIRVKSSELKRCFNEFLPT